MSSLDLFADRINIMQMESKRAKAEKKKSALPAEELQALQAQMLREARERMTQQAKYAGATTPFRSSRFDC